MPHHCNENKFFSTRSSRGKKRIKISDIRTDGIRKDVFYKDKKELAVFKNVVIKCRASGISYHKIAGVFRISSRTVHTWVSKIYAISKVLIHVNIQAVANALISNIHAYRNGWITELNIENILSGVEIH